MDVDGVARQRTILQSANLHAHDIWQGDYRPARHDRRRMVQRLLKHVYPVSANPY
jgi:hypothetical protein